LTGLGSGQDWIWREDRIQHLLSQEDADYLFLSGCAPNQGKFYPKFDHIILLTAPADNIVERLAARTTNPFGKRPDEVARALDLKKSIEPLLRRTAGYEIDTMEPIDRVVERILQFVGAAS
jgi:hypothetical protein